MNFDADTTLDDIDVSYHLHSQTNPDAHNQDGPYIVSHGDGPYIVDEQGRRYIDAMAGLWCASLGFNNQRLAEVAAQQYKRLGYYHSFYGRTNDPATQLSKKLVELTGMEGGKAYFTTSGSEANETMVKFAWLFHAVRGKPTKRKIIARDRGFHGSTIVAGSLCGLESMHREFGLPLPGFLHTLCPHPYRVKLEGETDGQFVTRLAAELERMILREGPDTVAAFIAEPVIAGGGIIVPPAGYFEAIQKILKKYDVLCLGDEVVCGFGRTGEWFGKDAVGMKPDMMALAKGITSSYFPLSAVVITPEIYEAIASVNKGGGALGHGFTNGGHPVGAAIALEAIAIYEEMDITARVQHIGAMLHERLQEACNGSPIVGDVRGIGLMYGVEFVEDIQTGAAFAPARQVGSYFAAQAYERGLVTRAMRDTIGFCPPLIVKEAHVSEMVSKFKDTLLHVEQAVQAGTV